MDSPLVTIDGSRATDGRRLLVYIEGREVPLRPMSFRLFAILALARRLELWREKPIKGWVHRDALIADPTLVTKYLYRMRQEIEQSHPDDEELGHWPVFEKHKFDRYVWVYRMLTSPNLVEVPHPEDLVAFDDHDVTNLLRPDER